MRRHGRLGDELGAARSVIALRAAVVEPAQCQQRAHAAAPVGLRAQDVGDERDAALQLSREIFDRHTI